MAKNSTNRRKSNLILRQLQGRILLQTTLFPIGAIAVLATAIVVLGRRLMATAAQAGDPVPDLGPLLTGTVMLTAAMAGAILYVAYRFSNRVAGPAYRVIQSLKSIREGDASFRVKLRPGDLLLQVIDELNVTLAALEQRFGESGTGDEAASTEAATLASGVETAVGATTEIGNSGKQPASSAADRQ